MSLAKIVEIVGCSAISFEAAIKDAIKRASKTIRGITGAQVISKNVKIRGNKIIEYRVNLKLAFRVEEGK